MSEITIAGAPDGVKPDPWSINTDFLPGVFVKDEDNGGIRPINPYDLCEMSDKEVDFYGRRAAYNERLFLLKKAGRLTADDMFGGSRLLDDLKPWLADWFKKDLGRDHRNDDGTIDFHRYFDDGCWDTDEVIVDALVPFIAGLYDYKYGGNFVGGVAWLGQKMALLNQYIADENYAGAAGCLSDGEVYDEHNKPRDMRVL